MHSELAKNNNDRQFSMPKIRNDWRRRQWPSYDPYDPGNALYIYSIFYVYTVVSSNCIILVRGKSFRAGTLSWISIVK
jgi:hypothetical protein